MNGQNAMEYLMSYGWAILIIVVIGAALYALGVLNPESYPRNNENISAYCSSLSYENVKENVTCRASYNIAEGCVCDVKFLNENGFVTGTATWYHVVR